MFNKIFKCMRKQYKFNSSDLGSLFTFIEIKADYE
jgi:hypothetical protein